MSVRLPNAGSIWLAEVRCQARTLSWRDRVSSGCKEQSSPAACVLKGLALEPDTTGLYIALLALGSQCPFFAFDGTRAYRVGRHPRQNAAELSNELKIGWWRRVLELISAEGE